MAKYRLKVALGPDPIEFTSPGPEGVLNAWRDAHKMPHPDHDMWRRSCAAMACDFVGKAFRYDSDEAFAADMIKHGLLEEVSA